MSYTGRSVEFAEVFWMGAVAAVVFALVVAALWHDRDWRDDQARCRALGGELLALRSAKACIRRDALIDIVPSPVPAR
jgi:hypothetical protein